MWAVTLGWPLFSWIQTVWFDGLSEKGSSFLPHKLDPHLQLLNEHQQTNEDDFQLNSWTLEFFFFLCILQQSYF